jgi:hypothetical protein
MEPVGFRAVGVPEARIEQTGDGAVVASPGWFVVNMADCAWTRDDKGGEWATYRERQAYRKVPRNLRRVKAPWPV